MVETGPAVTAVIVVLNGEAFLREAVDSVLAQSFDDWELLIVDDGSTDRTPDIIEEYAARFPDRIRLLAHPGRANLGISASRNLAIAQARGRYIAFLDADDLWMPEKLAEQVAILDSDDALGMVYGRSLIWHSWDPSAKQDDHYYPLGIEPNRRHDPPVLFELLMENKAQTPTTCNAMIRTDLFSKLGGFEPRFRGMFEDLTFFAKALLTQPVYVSDRTWAKYRQHPQSCTAVSSSGGRDASARLAALSWLARALKPLRPSRRAARAIRRARISAAAEVMRHRMRRFRRRFSPRR